MAKKTGVVNLIHKGSDRDKTVNYERTLLCLDYSITVYLSYTY